MAAQCESLIHIALPLSHFPRKSLKECKLLFFRIPQEHLNGTGSEKTFDFSVNSYYRTMIMLLEK